MKHDLPTGVTCPVCGSLKSRVVDTRGHLLPSNEQITWRRRRCHNSHFFTTYEHSAEMLREEEAAIFFPTMRDARVVIAGKIFTLTESET